MKKSELETRVRELEERLASEMEVVVAAGRLAATHDTGCDCEICQVFCVERRAERAAERVT